MPSQSSPDWFKELYQHEERGLFNVALRFASNPEGAMDLVHEAFLGLWKNRTMVEVSQAKAYLYQSILNRGKNLIRFKRFKKFVDLDIDSEQLQTGSEDEQINKQSFRQLNAYFAKLPDEQRSVLLLSEYSGFSSKEIAKMLNIPEGTVASRKNKAIERLRHWTKESQ